MLTYMKCVVINMIYMVKPQDRVLAQWGPSSVSAVAELVLFIFYHSIFYWCFFYIFCLCSLYLVYLLQISIPLFGLKFSIFYSLFCLTTS